MQTADANPLKVEEANDAWDPHQIGRLLDSQLTSDCGPPWDMPIFEGTAMPRGMANIRQLAMMARVMETYCTRFAIPDEAPEREYLALEVLILFDEGLRDEGALLAALMRRRPRRALGGKTWETL